MVLELREPVIFESSILRVTLDTEIVLPHFIFEWLRSPKGVQQISRIRSFTTVAGIAGSDLKKISVPVLPLADQEVIARELASMRASLGTISHRYESSRELQKRIREQVIGEANV